MQTCRGIRGAIGIELNTRSTIINSARRLLEEMVAANNVDIVDIASVVFTATADLTAVYPARAAREMGWIDTPLLCTQEMAVSDSIPRCLRVLLLWNTQLRPKQIQHVYLGRACVLRPDIANREANI